MNPAEASEVMEGVVRVLTFTGWIASDADTRHEPRSWQTSEEGGKIGRFQPDTEIAKRVSLLRASNLLRESKNFFNLIKLKFSLTFSSFFVFLCSITYSFRSFRKFYF